MSGKLVITLHKSDGEYDTGLVLTRNGQHVATIRIEEIKSFSQARVSIEAPKDVVVMRENARAWSPYRAETGRSPR